MSKQEKKVKATLKPRNRGFSRANMLPVWVSGEAATAGDLSPTTPDYNCFPGRVCMMNIKLDQSSAIIRV